MEIYGRKCEYVDAYDEKDDIITLKQIKWSLSDVELFLLKQFVQYILELRAKLNPSEINPSASTHFNDFIEGKGVKLANSTLKNNNKELLYPIDSIFYLFPQIK